MIVTGIAHPPERLHERGPLPSPELVYLAQTALKAYGAAHLVTSLAPGWEQALARAAIELEIPFTVAIPYPGRDLEWEQRVRLGYLDLLARASEVYRVSDAFTPDALLTGICWRTSRADLVLALWDFDFSGLTFQSLDYALRLEKTVVNLWKDWQHLYGLRKARSNVQVQAQKVGAQVFESRS